MEPLIWTPQFSVGVDELDRQHKRIVKFINALIEAQSSYSGSEIVSEVLTHMRIYGQEHFRCEEEYMRACQFPELEAHQQTHKEFKIQAAQYCNAVLEEQENINDRIFEFLLNWWKTHILETDMKYKPYLKSTTL